MHTQRIVSLIPSATEIVCALGLGSDLVGVSHECDYPQVVTKLPRLTRPRLEPNARGSAVDRQIREIVAKGLSIYNIELKLLESVQPDLIITQDQCHVCAVSLKEVEEAVCSLLLKQTKLCSLMPHSLADIYDDVRKVGAAIGAESQAATLVEEMKRSLGKLSDRNWAKRPRVVCVEWMEPAMVAGGWIPELVKIAGGDPLIVSGPERFKHVEWATIVKLEPDLVCLFPCGYPLKQTLSEIEDRKLKLSLRTLHSKGIKVVACDGNAYFNRPGPRIVDSAEMLAGLFHEEAPEFAKKYESAYQVLRSKE